MSQRERLTSMALHFISITAIQLDLLVSFCPLGWWCIIVLASPFSVYSSLCASSCFLLLFQSVLIDLVWTKLTLSPGKYISIQPLYFPQISSGRNLNHWMNNVQRLQYCMSVRQKTWVCMQSPVLVWV